MQFDGYYYFLISSGWLLSLILFAFAITRYKTPTFLDVFIVLSWFYVFFRPLVLEYCDIDTYLYHWDPSSYTLGVYLSIVCLLLLQFGSLLASRNVLSRLHTVDDDYLHAQLKVYGNYGFCVVLGVTALMFAKFGGAVFASNRGGGALSVSLPGLEYFFHFMGPFITLTITAHLFVFLKTRSYTSAMVLLLCLAILMVFGKRGRIVMPVLSAVVLYLIYWVWFCRRKVYRFFNIRIILTMLFVVFILFFGKQLASSNSEVERPTGSLACSAVKFGMQEYDLFWPAVIEIQSEKTHLLDLPKAIVGSLVFNHEARLASGWHSATDKAMLRYNHDQYRYNKFGISPNLFQFYFFYTGFFCVLVMLFLGWVLRRLDFRGVKYFFEGNIFFFILVGVLTRLVMSPFDFTIKYFVFELFAVVSFFYLLRYKYKF